MDLPAVELEGSPRAMGEAFGAQFRAEARELYAIRMRWARLFAEERGRRFTEDEALAVARKGLPRHRGLRSGGLG
ncbi:MAG: hypothetical protein M5U26_15810 [Planctomycetota bacterium]|nr:hypothetical protein [Planctomycetota bacterium]